jgi:hypothetical protein
MMRQLPKRPPLTRVSESCHCLLSLWEPFSTGKSPWADALPPDNHALRRKCRTGRQDSLALPVEQNTCSSMAATSHA